MEWRRVKNIIILILLLVNGFLLILVGVRTGEVRRYEQSAVDQAIRVLENKGIRVASKALEEADGLTVQAADRSVAREGTIAAGLLGEEVTVSNMGGGLYTYRGSRGTVNFRSGGALSAELTEDGRWYTDDPQTAVRQLLSGIGVEAEVLSDTVAGGTGTVTVCQQWQQVPVFSCRLVFSYEDGRLVSLSGNILAIEQSAAEVGELLSLPTALMRFLDEISSSGDVCSEVVSMRPGYRVSQSFTSAVHLDPVWLISSNTAEYYMDAVTGALSRTVE